MKKLDTIAKDFNRYFDPVDQAKPCQGDTDRGNSEWHGYDYPTDKGGVLRICQSGEGEAIEVMTFDDPTHMICQTNASFGTNVPKNAIVAYCHEMIYDLIHA